MSDISELVECALGDTASCEDLALGRFPNFKCQEIASSTGVRLHGVLKVITAYGVKHTIKQHGNHAEEIKRGQIGVTNSDFDLLEDILNNPDDIIKGSIERGKQSILFLKRYTCRYFVAMILEGKKGEEKLVLRTMYKKP